MTTKPTNPTSGEEGGEKCMNCDGTGESEVPLEDGNMWRCPQCNGTGKVISPAPPPTTDQELAEIKERVRRVRGETESYDGNFEVFSDPVDDLRSLCNACDGLLSRLATAERERDEAKRRYMLLLTAVNDQTLAASIKRGDGDALASALAALAEMRKAADWFANHEPGSYVPGWVDRIMNPLAEQPKEGAKK